MGKKHKNKQLPFSPHPPSSSDIVSCSSRMELVSEEKQLQSVDSGKHLKPMSSVLDTSSASLKLLHAHAAAAQHHQSFGRSAFFKRSRQHYAHQYSRRNSGHVAANASTSRGKGTPSREEKLSYKFATQCSYDSGRTSEIKEKPFFQPARIRSSYLVVNSAAADPSKTSCRICQKPLRRKPLHIGITMSSTEVSVVAVLVCGHVYHADCLEQKTSFEERRDPPCPLCVGLLPLKIE